MNPVSRMRTAWTFRKLSTTYRDHPLNVVNRAKADRLTLKNHISSLDRKDPMRWGSEVIPIHGILVREDLDLTEELRLPESRLSREMFDWRTFISS